jgi:hypothetical protein
MIRPDWAPATIALMVLGFIVFWPLGLAMLGYILFGRKLQGLSFGSGEGRIFGGRMFRAGAWGCGRTARRYERHFSAGPFSSGNMAFDDWRRAELDRIEEERRKLEEMRDEFDTYSRELRRAKDQEEFDRFMRQRGNRPSDNGNDASSGSGQGT